MFVMLKANLLCSELPVWVYGDAAVQWANRQGEQPE
jgi:hypothetical protein